VSATGSIDPAHAHVAVAGWESSTA
jgi:hypothetical protein